MGIQSVVMDSADDHSDGGQQTQFGEESIRDIIERQEEEGTSVSVFKNHELVDPTTIIDADRIVGRDEQLESIVANLRPALKGQRPPNMLLFGPSGTGKSLIINAVGNHIHDICTTKNVDFGIISLNCQMVDTLDRASYELCTTIGDSVGVDPEVPSTGISTKDKLDRLYEIANDHFDVLLFVLDEIDYLERADNSGEPAYSKLLYQLSRAGVEGKIEGQCSVAALTNDPQFMENIDGRADSSFNPESIHFPDYDANQISKILEHRRDAFRPDALDTDVIPLTAAFAAQSHGDARKAIDLIRKAGELADQEDAEKVRDDHVKEAQDAIDIDRTRELITGLAQQKQIALYATAATREYGDVHPVPSPIGFDVYSWITEEADLNQMTRETYIKYMKELGSYGLIEAERKGRGQGMGQRVVFTFLRPASAVLEALNSEQRFSEIEESSLESVAQAQVRRFD